MRTTLFCANFCFFYLFLNSLHPTRTCKKVLFPLIVYHLAFSSINSYYNIIYSTASSNPNTLYVIEAFMKNTTNPNIIDTISFTIDIDKVFSILKHWCY